MTKLLFFSFLFFTFCSCSAINSKNELKKELANSGIKYSYVDKNGKYIVKLLSSFEKKDSLFFTKKSLEIPDKEKDNVLEQSITFSELGSVRKKINILRPKKSQYSVWFDSKKYFSELTIDPQRKAVEVKMQSPEANWNGVNVIKFPSTKIVPCFFSQIIECAKVSGFIERSIRKKSGRMKMLILWEGYPYLNETFSDMPSELFSNAILEYDGSLNSKETRFSLKVSGQSIFFILDKDLMMKKMFWVSQGISMVEYKEYIEESKAAKDETNE